MVVAVIGSTEESAVDDIARILALKPKYEAKGLTFSVHADAAWGGYLNCMTHETGDKESNVYSNCLPTKAHDFVPAIPLSDFVKRQYVSLQYADTAKEPEPTCKDKYNYGNLKKYCSYSQYKDYMTNYCPATCGLCGETLACGVAERRGSKADNPIVGGEDAKKGHYPWQAAIYFDGSFLCGGSLIDNKHLFSYLRNENKLIYFLILLKSCQRSNEN
uniref:ShKT domain-containing protein n=1 Tax=Clytia hemisphaerica TaxID=252671 RepID=A0A7M5WXW1_9CNID